MLKESIKRLDHIINKASVLLLEIDDEEMSKKMSPEKWSKKEIVGHLVDSATNNHQRFVRAQFEHHPEIRYDQNKWIEFSFYQEIDTRQIISFWAIYNKQLIEIVKHIPADNLKRQIKIGDELLTLEFLVIDYVRHLEHHLKQIVDY